MDIQAGDKVRITRPTPSDVSTVIGQGECTGFHYTVDGTTIEIAWGDMVKAADVDLPDAASAVPEVPIGLLAQLDETNQISAA